MHDKSHASDRVLDAAELANAKLTIDGERYDTQVVQTLNSHPKSHDLWNDAVVAVNVTFVNRSPTSLCT